MYLNRRTTSRHSAISPHARPCHLSLAYPPTCPTACSGRPVATRAAAARDDICTSFTAAHQEVPLLRGGHVDSGRPVTASRYDIAIPHLVRPSLRRACPLASPGTGRAIHLPLSAAATWTVAAAAVAPGHSGSGQGAHGVSRRCYVRHCTSWHCFLLVGACCRVAQAC